MKELREIAGEQPVEDERRYETKKQDQEIQVLSVSDRIRTEEEAFKYGGFDPAVWYVHQSEVTSNECPMKLKTADKTHKPIVVRLWRIKLVLRRKVPRYVELSSAALLERMKKYSPKWGKLPKIKKVSDPHLLEICLFDHHFGKLAHHAETGNNYDLKIAEEIYHSAMNDLVSKARGFPVERFLLPLGNDFFHVDGLENKTTAGTPQDCDGRYWKVFDAGVWACIKGVESLIQHAPVDILWVPGNHDATASGHLVRSLQMFYRGNSRVTVDVEPRERKLYPYGRMVLGFTHGNEEKPSSLVPLMQDEAKDLLPGRSLEIHVGHFHKAKEVVYTNTDSFAGGVRVRTIPSLSGVDKWHYRRGFVGTRAAEAYLWSKSDGYSGHLSSNYRS